MPNETPNRIKWVRAESRDEQECARLGWKPIGQETRTDNSLWCLWAEMVNRPAPQTTVTTPGNSVLPPLSEAAYEQATMPEIAEWLVAYAAWLPSAIAEGHTQVNDAFRAGFLAGIARYDKAN